MRLDRSDLGTDEVDEAQSCRSCPDGSLDTAVRSRSVASANSAVVPDPCHNQSEPVAIDSIDQHRLTL